jgi:hypothetical protein
MKVECGDANKFIIEINALLDELAFRPDISEKFEEAMKRLAVYIGFIGQRPEAEFKKGPDVLWRLGKLQCLVIECKNGATADTISKHYCDQLGGSINWFEQEYGSDCSATPIIIHPVSVFSRECSPHRGTRVITREKLDEFRSALQDFATMMATPSTFGNTEQAARALKHFNLTTDTLIDRFTVEYTIEN